MTHRRSSPFRRDKSGRKAVDHTDVDIVNDLVTHRLRHRGGSTRLSGNLDDQPLSFFADGLGGDLHLASPAIDHRVAVAAGLCDDDIDGEEVGQFFRYLPLAAHARR